MKTCSILGPLGLALSVLVTATALGQEIRDYPLPAALSYLEGIGYDSDGSIYTVGSTDGIVVRTNVKSGESKIIVKPGVVLPAGKETFPGILGMKVDSAKRLWMMGGITGKVFVLDTPTGKLVKTLTTPGEGGLLNDGVVTPTAVYITDTFRPTLWKVPLNGGEIGQPEVWIDLQGSPIQHSQGPNLNGIAKTPDGKTLFVIQMNKGLLFKIDVATKVITPIDVAGEALSGGDGLELDGQTLYVVRQTESEVVTVRLAADFKSGKVISRLKDPALKWPATAVKVGTDLLVVNSQFNKRDSKNPVTPFAVAAIPLTRLSGK